MPAFIGATIAALHMIFFGEY